MGWRGGAGCVRGGRAVERSGAGPCEAPGALRGPWRPGAEPLRRYGAGSGRVGRGEAGGGLRDPGEGERARSRARREGEAAPAAALSAP